MLKKHAALWPIAEKAIRENSLVDDIWLMSNSKAEVEQGKRGSGGGHERDGNRGSQMGVKLSRIFSRDVPKGTKSLGDCSHR